MYLTFKSFIPDIILWVMSSYDLKKAFRDQTSIN